MARYRLVHVGTAALLSAAVMTTVGIAQSAMAIPSASEASSWVPIVPCRLMDTRVAAPVGDRETPLGPAETATVTVAGEHGNCVIPETATGITGNITVTNMTAASFLTAFPSNASLPNTSTLNWRPANQPVANHVAISLSPNVVLLTESLPPANSGAIKLYNHAGTVDVIVDITGYFEPSIGGLPGPQGEPGVDGEDGVDGENGVGDLGCEIDQSITWDGEAWQCVNPAVDTDTLAALDCTVNQSIRWNGTAWECRNEPIVATLSRVANPPPFDFGITNVFQAYSPNVDTSTDYFCDVVFCSVHLVDVIDHTSCQVTFSGNSMSDVIDVVKFTDRVDVNFIYQTNQTEPLYVSLSCNT